MTELNATDFVEFFTALWGKEKPPFAWQLSLAKRVLERAQTLTETAPISTDCSDGNITRLPWPEAIALPTASGKTACLDIAVFALAAQASRLNRNQPTILPRRVFFVVDRRVIVDEAYERACRLKEKLEKANTGILKKVADNLREIAHDQTTPLASYVLRGGIYRSEAWARNPLQPTLVTSTVDQIGSRMLFRAYGRGSNTWPIYAGLIANDSLILLDEAHCAQPFLQTLQAVRHFQRWGHAPLKRFFHFVVMSATPPPGIKDQFGDQSDENRSSNHPLGRRQMACKPSILKTVEKAKGTRATIELAKALAKAGLGLINQQRRAIIIFVNRVATAREIYRLLKSEEEVDSVLLTGRMRSLDKDAIVLEHLQPLKSDQSDERILTRPLIVVATQTLEVGADLDFDGLATECASLDSLRQRFGRLNRMGRPIEARAEILVRGDQINTLDPVYGQALSKTWDWLSKNKDKNGEVDFGIAHLDKKLPENDLIATLNAPALNAPVMLPAHVDSWSQTAPEPLLSPDVTPFLHGQKEGTATVQVCWRADLDLTNKKEIALELLSLCPPSSSETLPVPIRVFKQWLIGEETTDNTSDVEGEDNAGVNETPSPSNANAENLIIRWRGAETNLESITSNPSEIRPGDVIVIPYNHPGDCHHLGDLPPEATEPPTAIDIGDQTYRLTRAKPILRLHRKLVESWPSITPKATALELLEDLKKYDDDPDSVTNTLSKLLTELAEFTNSSGSLPKRWAWLPEAAKELRNEYSGYKLRHAYQIVGDETLIIVGRHLLPKLALEADCFGDEDDSNASGISYRNGQPVRLRKHLSGVEKFARIHASGCGLSKDMVEGIARAGLLHDLGKADPRFQSKLRGGMHWLGGEPLAKSADIPKIRTILNQANKASGYPKNGRHELLSVRMAESVPGILPRKDHIRDLTLHLIASHHGRCRPFAPVVFDKQNQEVSFELSGHKLSWRGPTGLEHLDSGVAERYWRLVRRYGWWGLAWLEALLRLADWRRSEWEERHNDG